jgi:outer membrane protein assembly factor BamB
MRSALPLFLLVLCTRFSQAENWPNWRGPYYNGSSAEAGLPESWSRTDNVAWAADLPGPSAATPIIWDDHVFISSCDLQRKKLVAICLDACTGNRLWQHDIGDEIRRDSRSTYASPSPVTDGSTVVFFFGNGPLVAFDFQGQRIWQRDIQNDYGEFAFLWTFSTSPIIHDGKVFLQVLQRDVPVDGRGFADRKNDSYLLALDLKTGSEIWRRVRPSQAVAESREAFTTPIIANHNGTVELVVAGGDDVTGHDPETGEELWRWGTWNPSRIGHWRQVTSPVFGAGTILLCAPKSEPIYAIKAGGKGRLSDDDVQWISREQKVISSDVPTPAFYDGDFIVLSDVRKSISRVEPASGDAKWTTRLPGTEKFEASPLAADGKIYLMNFAGDVVVINAENGSLIHTISMDDPSDDPSRSSIAAANGKLFIRTSRKLYCVGK